MMSDQTKKKWVVQRHEHGKWIDVVDTDSMRVFSIDPDEGGEQVAEYIVSLQGAILEAGIDPDKLVEDGAALAGFIEWVNNFVGDDIPEIRMFLDRLGVKP